MAYTFPISPVGSIYLATLHMTWCGQKLMNTYTYRLEENPNNNTVGVLCDGLDAKFAAANKLYPTHKTLRDLNCALDKVTIQQIATLRYVAKTYVKAEAGTVAGTTDTANLSAAISRRSVRADRRGVGTIKIPLPIATTTIVDGVLTEAYETLLTAHAAVMLEEIETDTAAVFRPVLFHRDLNPNFSYVEEVFHQEYARTMSRRTVGRGI